MFGVARQMALLHDEQADYNRNYTYDVTCHFSGSARPAEPYVMIHVISVVISCSSCRNAIYRAAPNIEKVPQTSRYFLYRAVSPENMQSEFKQKSFEKTPLTIHKKMHEFFDSRLYVYYKSITQCLECKTSDLTWEYSNFESTNNTEEKLDRSQMKVQQASKLSQEYHVYFFLFERPFRFFLRLFFGSAQSHSLKPHWQYSPALALAFQKSAE